MREFLCSEAMDALGIPTTRAGSTITSDSLVERDVFYSGDVIHERCTVITRIAKSFLRFGSFEIFKGQDSQTGRSGPSHGNIPLLCKLVDYVCRFLYPEIHLRYLDGTGASPAPAAAGAAGGPTAGGGSSSTASSTAMEEEPARGKEADAGTGTGTAVADSSSTPWDPSAEWAEEQGAGSYAPPGTQAGAARVLAVYEEICRRTARLVAGWQLVGWCHGVLNTDNMSILGLTIDYGPYGFMDRFDREYICNHSDDSGRYAFENQPSICRWNCERLGESWSHAMPGAAWRESLIDAYDTEFGRAYRDGTAAKLGVRAMCGGAGNKDSVGLYESLLDVMQRTGADFTNTFQALSLVRLSRRADMPTAVGRLARGDTSGGVAESGSGEEGTKEGTGGGTGGDPSSPSVDDAGSVLGCAAVSDAWELLRRQLSPANELADAAKPRMPREQL